MNVKELRRREDFDRVLARTIETNLADRLGTRLTVSMPASPGDQDWLMHSTFSAFFTADASKRTRRFMADSFRFTAVRRRAIPQFVLGTLLAMRPALRISATRTFSISPPIPNASHRLFLPGNRRIRLFDFASKTCTVLLKDGFSADAIASEVSIRKGVDGPFPRVLSASLQARWFEEEIVDGWSLARCPPWRSRQRAEVAAFAKLDEWRRPTRSEVPARAHAEGLRASIVESQRCLEAGGLGEAELEPRLLDEWVRAASRLGHVSLSMTHGDFQPGNVFVLKTGGVLVLDWEYAARRFEHYDRFVYALAMRFGGDLKSRLARYLRGGDFGCSLPGPAHTAAWRQAAVAMFLLEEMGWRLRDTVSGPFTRLPPDLVHEVEQLRDVTPMLGGG